MVWAGPGFALRAPQRAGDSSGLEEMSDALSRSEEGSETWVRVMDQMLQDWIGAYAEASDRMVLVGQTTGMDPHGSALQVVEITKAKLLNGWKQRPLSFKRSRKADGLFSEQIARMESALGITYWGKNRVAASGANSDVVVAEEKARLQVFWKRPQFAAGLEEPLPLENYFEIIPATRADAETVLFTYPPDPTTLRLYREAGDKLFVLLPQAEPLGADPDLLSRLVQQVNPHHLEIFVNEKIDAGLLDKAATPRLKGIHSKGVGFGNIDLVAAARRGIRPTYVGGAENPLRWATAEMAEALALAGRFDLLRRIEPATSATPRKQLLGELLRKLAHRRGMSDHTTQQILWAQLMRQMRKLDDAGRMVQEDRARGAGNGLLRTVEGHQLAADPEGSGIQTSLGLLPGSALDLARWGALARAHGVHKLFYTGERHEIFETRYGMVYIPSVFGLLRESEYVLRAPDGPGLPQPLLDSVGAGRDYPWLVDPDRLALTEGTSAADQKQLLGSGLDKKVTVGILGLGSIGSIAAADLRPMGIQLLSVIHDVGKRDRYERLAGELEGIEYVDLPELVSRSDVLILALPETDETRGILTPELLNGIGSDREVVIVNVGRGTAVGATPEEEQAFADWLKAHPNVRYYTDVLRNEFLPAAKQPLLDPALAAQVFYSGHIASNTADPTGHRTRSAMGRTQFENFRADRTGLPPPNPVPMPDEAEKILSQQN